MNLPIFTLNSSRIFYGFRAVFALGFLFLTCSQSAKAWTLTCPEDYTIVLPPGECGVAISYDSVSFTSSIPLVDTVYFPFPGTFIETGVTSVTLATVDINGDMAVCTFNITVLTSNATNLSCPAQSSISLQGQCSRSLTAQDVLGPNSFPCQGDYLVQRLNENNVPVTDSINAFDVNESFNVLLTNTTTGAICTTLITVTGGTPSSITCPDEVLIFCNEPVDSSYTGVPELTGCYQEVELSYTDAIEGTFCPDTFAFQILRTWVSTDPFGKKDTCEQFITAKRYDPSMSVFPPDFDGTQLPPLSCNDTLSWPDIVSTEVTGVPLFQGFPAGDGAHCKIGVSYLDFETNTCGAAWENKRVWKIVKICPPSFTLLDTQLIRIVDILPPQFEMPDTFFVSLSSDCADSLFLPPAEVTAECSDWDIVIETPWDTLTTNGGVLHFDSIAGAYPIRYILTDACDNQAIKNITLLVENETLVSCPPDDTITCNLYFDSVAFALASSNNAVLSSFLGNPVYHTNCEFVLGEIDSFEVNSCGEGFIQRKIFNLNADDPFTCTQHITVVHVSDFEVQFPADTSICIHPDAAQTGEPVIFNENCENIVVTYEDMNMTAGPPGCYTLQRLWAVVNSCTYDPNAPELPDEETGERRFKDGGDGVIQYAQTIHVNVTTPSFPAGCDMPDRYLGPTDCTAMVIVPEPPVAGCDNLNLTVSGSLGTELGAELELEAGQYQVNFELVDACGHSKTCTTQFEVFDTISPVAYCKNGLVLEITPNGIIQLFAEDLDASSFDNCPDLMFSLEPDSFQPSLVFTCDDLCEPQHEITLWVTDPSGNQAHCETFVEIQNSLANCDACTILLGGHIRTENDQGISNSKVNIAAMSFSDTILVAGSEYEFIVEPSNDYSITCYKNDGPLNGVSTFDMVLIQKHILGTQPLGSPYKIIAADINKSNSVTTFDLVALRKMILFIDTEFVNNTSWRFVPADFVFPNPANPFQTTFPGINLVNDPLMGMFDLDFIGIKTGDVNGSASTDARKPEEMEDEK